MLPTQRDNSQEIIDKSLEIEKNFTLSKRQMLTCKPSLVNLPNTPR